jgi:hypothetical protein
MKASVSAVEKFSPVVSFRPEADELAAFNTAVESLGVSRSELALLAFRRGYRIAVEELAKQRRERLESLENANKAVQKADTEFRAKAAVVEKTLTEILSRKKGMR